MGFGAGRDLGGLGNGLAELGGLSCLLLVGLDGWDWEGNHRVSFS